MTCCKDDNLPFTGYFFEECKCIWSNCKIHFNWGVLYCYF